MAIWNIVFYPSSGSRHSPHDYIGSLSKKNEIALIYRRLKTIQELPMEEWPSKWIKKIGSTYQLAADNQRVYFGLEEKTIVVCYACRKVSQKARKEDLRRAEENFKSYHEERREL